MYAPAYGYGPGNSSSASQFNPNGAPPQPYPPHQQQQQHQAQQMYNPQQYGPGSQHGAPAPVMGGNAGAMMQNNGMAQMAGHVPPYQTPYSGSPYGINVPSGSLPPNFMPPVSGAPSFPQNSMNMNPQAQRMQPPPPSSTPTQPGPRPSPFAGAHNTPPNAGPQSQFSPPQATNQTHLQTRNQAQASTIITPQTPNFPPGSQGVNPMATPLSPGSEAREKDRVTLLLDINRLLLLEVMALQAAQAEAKEKESMSEIASPDGNKEKSEKEKAEKAEKSKPATREYFECMRRLQSNLAYLAAIADRSHKPSSQIPPHPAIMTAPPLTKSPSTTSSPNPAKKEDLEDKKPEDEQDRNEALKDQYKKLQALFPGVDPKKEPQMNVPNAAARAAQAQAQKLQQGQGQAQDPKLAMQNELMRQNMLQQQAQQQAQQNAQQQMGQVGGR